MGNAVKAAIHAVDRILFVSPEYNDCVPEQLKHAIARPRATDRNRRFAVGRVSSWEPDPL
ncbi:MAG: NAD(P)H-dependent oxidoreductase [Gemmatimonas sp.]